jgi:Lon-like protease
VTRRSRTVTLLVTAPLLAVLAVLTFALPVPYVVLSPGPVFNALGEIGGTPVVSIDGAPTYPTDGVLDVTTVYETGGPGSRVSLVGAVKAWLDPGSDVVPRELLFPDGTDQTENDQRSVEEMELSQQTAVAAALRYLDKPVRTVTAVGSVQAGSPAVGKLRAGDQFVTIDGQRVHSPDQVRKLISARTPGDPVDLVMRRDGELVPVTVVTEAAEDDPSRAVVGVMPTLVYVSPVDVTISLANVGGPSAGLMFSLSIVDKMTPGSLTGGQRVAGTGTIDAQGKVGAIGGIQQKMAGASDEGAELFLAPFTNCSDVVGHVPDGLTVVPVRSLSDAVGVVERFVDGERGLPSCSL